MLANIMFFAVTLFALTMGIYEYQEACNTLAKVLSIISIVLTSIIAATAFVVITLLEKGVIVL